MVDDTINIDGLLEYLEPLRPDESKYGCGPILDTNTTYYLSLDGNDDHDGLSWKTAWRNLEIALPKLVAGDTLRIAGGTYRIPRIRFYNNGEPGKPITVKADSPGTVLLTTARGIDTFIPTPGLEYVCEASIDVHDKATVWESDTRISLQDVGMTENVAELPGTFCTDVPNKKIYVRFSDESVHPIEVLGSYPPGSGSSHPLGFVLGGTYLNLEGLKFGFDHTVFCIAGPHNTIQKCSFSHSNYAGLLLTARAHWNFIKENYGSDNGHRGSILIAHADVSDNLIIGNHLDPSVPTMRQGGPRYHYCINNYGAAGRRNHIINNVLNCTKSFRSKYLFKETVIQGNLMVGECMVVPDSYEDITPDPIDRVVFRNNIFLGSVISTKDQIERDDVSRNWIGPELAFINNTALSWNDVNTDIPVVGVSIPIAPIFIDNVDVKTKSHKLSVISWTTSMSDTVGYVMHRIAGTTQWAKSATTEQGTKHYVGLLNLHENRDVEFYVHVDGRRGGSADTDLRTFRNPGFSAHNRTTYYVSEHLGDDTNDGLFLESSWKTIRQACLNVLPGDTVIIYPGLYRHPVEPLSGGEVGKPITFKSVNTGDVIISGGGYRSGFVKLEYKNYIVIDGLQFCDSPVAGGAGELVQVHNSDNVSILNCRIGYREPESGFVHGISIRSSKNTTLNGNVIWGPRYPIFATSSPGLIIRNNTIVNGKIYGITIRAAESGPTTITNNVLAYPTITPNAAISLWGDPEVLEVNCDYNVYHLDSTGKLGAFSKDAYRHHIESDSLTEWQAESGLDTHSVQAGPLFKDIDKGDFTLLEGSPAIGLGDNNENAGASNNLTPKQEPWQGDKKMTTDLFDQETLGTAVIDDDCADDNTGDWNKADCTLTFSTDYYEIEVVNPNTVYTYQANVMTPGDVYKLGFDSYIPSTNVNVDRLTLRASTSNLTIVATMKDIDAWGSRIVSHICESATLDNAYFYLTVGTVASGLNPGDIVRLRNILVEPIVAPHKGTYTWPYLAGTLEDSGSPANSTFYRIMAQSIVDFTTIGSPDNSVGTYFYSTGTGVTLSADDNLRPVQASWAQSSTNLISIDEVNDKLVITGNGSDDKGATLAFSAAADLSEDLEIGATYVVTVLGAQAINGDVDIEVAESDDTQLASVTLTGDAAAADVELEFVCTHATTNKIQLDNLASGEVVKFSGLTIVKQEAGGNKRGLNRLGMGMQLN